MRSSKLKRSHKNGSTHQHPGNTQMLSKLQYQWGEGRLKGAIAGAHNSKYGSQSLG